METTKIREKISRADSKTDEKQNPDPALKRLDALVGDWKIEGYVPEHDENVSGKASFKWLPGGFFLVQRFTMNFFGQQVEGMEIIGYDTSTRTFISTVYSNLSGAAIPYKWDIRGSIVMHSTEGSGYTGRFSHDGNTLIGRWEPEEGKASAMNIAYDTTMTKLKN